MNNKINKKELIAYSQVYDTYNLYSEETKKNIPQEFVKKLENIIALDSSYTGKIKSFEDLKKTELSDFAKKLIGYMGLNIT